MATKITTFEHLQIASNIVKKFINGLVGEVVGTTAAAIEELEKKSINKLKIFTVSNETEVDTLFTEIEADITAYTPGFIVSTSDMFDYVGLKPGCGILLIDVDGTTENALMVPFSNDDVLSSKEPIIMLENYTWKDGELYHYVSKTCSKCKIILEIPASNNEFETISITLGKMFLDEEARSFKIPVDANEVTRVIINVNLEWHIAEYNWTSYIGNTITGQGVETLVRENVYKSIIYLANMIKGLKIILSEYQ